MKKNIFLAVVFLVLGFSLFAAGTNEKQIDIYYSASLNGNLDGCECKSNPRSGLVKRAVYLRNIDKNSSVILETGDIFDVYPDELLSDYILKSYLELGYDAIAVGDQEFSNGISYLLERIIKYPFLGNNLSIKTENGNLVSVSKKPLIISKKGVDVAVLSIIDPEVFRFYPVDITESIEIMNPSNFISLFLSSPETKKADLRLLLFHGSLENVRQIALKNPSLDIIIAGHEQQTVDGEMIGNTILVSPGGEGNMLGHLKVVSDGKELIFDNSFIKFDYMTDSDDPLIRERINEYTKKMTEKLKK